VGAESSDDQGVEEEDGGKGCARTLFRYGKGFGY